MGSVVRAVASDLDPAAAAELRDELVRNAPEGMREVDEASLSARHCFLAEVPANPVRMSFAEWVKTREEGELGGMGGFLVCEVWPLWLGQCPRRAVVFEKVSP